MVRWIGRWALQLNLLGFLLNAGIYLWFGILSSLWMALLNGAIILVMVKVKEKT